MSVMRTKSVEQAIQETEEPEHRLRKDLSGLDLMVFGVGVIIGTGIFVLTGEAAQESAGPAIAISFVLAAIACGFAGLCYAEFASTVPVAGSAYTFSYAGIGELLAWIIGWDLILELLIGAATVSVGWSQYLSVLLETIGWELPTSISSAEDGVFNLPAALIALVLTAVLVTGIRISSRINAIIVTIKLAVVLFVIVAGLFFVKAANYTPFIPPTKPSEGESGLSQTLIQAVFGSGPAAFGVSGVLAAAALVFFAYIGFDVVATTAEETKNPQRDVPRGILGSLLLCTILYVAVSLVVVGMVKYDKLDPEAPLASAFRDVGHPFFADLITIGALAGLTTVIMVLMLGQSRVAFAMSRDGLLPPKLGKVHPRFGTPYVITIIVGVIVSILAGLLPLSALAEMVNIGTLSAFVLVSISVFVLRRKRPDLPRAFRVKGLPVVSTLAVISCLILMLFLEVATWLRFLIWMAAGFAIYFGYGHTHSRLARQEREDEPARVD